MEPHAVLRHLVVWSRGPGVCAAPPARAARVARAAVLVVVVLSAARPALAQFEFTGSWTSVGSEDFSNDSLPVDYMGLPLTEEGRSRALSYSESRLAMVEHQCEAWPPTYLATAGFGLIVTRDTEPIKGTTVSYTIGAWSDRVPTVIWMDGRPHPSKYALHPRSGFTTGRWEGNTLVTYTTHMKTGNLRKTGPPISDEATMTTRYFRHGDVLTMLSVIEDPVYLTEPMVWTKSYQAAEAEIASQVLACITTFEGTTPGEVPHYPPDKNPFIDEMSKKYGLPREVVLGYAETLYPEYRQKMKAASGR
jgi:hypothetical protein